MLKFDSIFINKIFLNLNLVNTYYFVNLKNDMKKSSIFHLEKIMLYWIS